MMSSLNIVLYINSDEKTVSNKKIFYSAGVGYTYDPKVPGKKKLMKDVPTTNGFYTGGEKSSSNVVIPENFIIGRYPLCKDGLVGSLSIVKKVLDYLKEINKTGNIAIVSFDTKLTNILNLTLDKLESVKSSKDFISNNFKLIEEIKTLQEELKVNFYLDNTVLVEGGRGSRELQRELRVAQLFSLHAETPTLTLDVLDIKEYENPSSDLPGVINGNRWYFNTGVKEEFYKEINGYRLYQFGKVDKKKKYYGKVTPDVSYSTFFYKKPIKYLDNLFEFCSKRIKNPKELLLAGNMQYMSSKDIIRLNTTIPGIPQRKEIMAPFRLGNKDDGTLIELIDPPALSYLILEDSFEKEVIFNSFINRDGNNRFGEHQHFKDITDLFFEKSVNKKGVEVLKLASGFSSDVIVLKTDLVHRLYKSKIPVTLSIGIDTPTRNNFNSVVEPEVKVWINYEDKDDKCLYYRLILETNDWIYVHSAAKGVNVRILNKKELSSLI